MYSDNIELTDEEIEYAEEQQTYYQNLADNKPKIVFKYRALSSATDVVRAVDIIRNLQLYLPTVAQLNDPFEGGNIDCLSEEENRKLLETRNEHRILALSRNCFSAPMWAYYAGNASGVCLGFFTDRSFLDIEPVEYLQKIDKKSMISFEGASGTVWKEYTCKNQDWMHEEEYRIQSNGKEELFHFSKDEFACVILGEAIDYDVKNLLISESESQQIEIFDLKSDRNRSRFYLVPCAESSYKIYDIEELYKYLVRTNI